MCSWVKSGVFDKGDSQNVQCWGAPRTRVKKHYSKKRDLDLAAPDQYILNQPKVVIWYLSLKQLNLTLELWFVIQGQYDSYPGASVVIVRIKPGLNQLRPPNNLVYAVCFQQGKELLKLKQSFQNRFLRKPWVYHSIKVKIIPYLLIHSFKWFISACLFKNKNKSK